MAWTGICDGCQQKKELVCLGLEFKGSGKRDRDVAKWGVCRDCERPFLAGRGISIRKRKSKRRS